MVNRFLTRIVFRLDRSGRQAVPGRSLGSVRRLYPVGQGIWASCLFIALLFSALVLVPPSAVVAQTKTGAAANPSIESVAADGALTVRFGWASSTDYSLVRADKLVIVRFSQPIGSDVSGLSAPGAEFFAEVRKGGNNRLVIFRLKGDTPVSHKRIGNVVEIVFGTAKPVKAPAPQLVTLGVSKGTGFQRLKFEWPAPVAFRFAPEAKRATLLFDKPGRLRTAAARAELERLGIRVSGRRVGDRLLVTLEFNEAVRLRAAGEGRRVNVDVFPAAGGAATGGGATGKGPALSARLDVTAGAGATEVTVDWPAAVSAAVFRYGGFTWLVFGAPARFDLSNVKRKLGPGIEDIEQIILDNATILRLRTARDIAPSVSREGWQWRIRLAKGKGSARTSVYVRSDPAAPNGGRVVMLTGSTGSVISVTDPAVGSLLFIVPVNAPGLGMRRARDYVKFRLLPTVQGLAIVPKADDLAVSHSGDDVEVTNPHGLALSGSK